jgi:putative ATP-binding cassette transporter
MLLAPSERWESSDPGSIAKRVSETSFYCLYLVNGFSVFVNLSSAFGDFAGCTSRIHEMLVALKSGGDALPVQSVRALQPSSSVAFALENACFGPPSIGLCCSVSVAIGERVLLTGPSGSGKTSIFRALTGLWPLKSGSLSMHAGTNVICVPQLTHTFNATLLELVVYPITRWEVTQDDFKLACDAAAAAAISPSMLQELHNRECQRDWGSELSAGELQRVGFARLLFSCAAADCSSHLLLLLDEATSSLPPSCEKQLYSTLQVWLSKRQGASTIVTVSHRPELQALHDRILLMPL